MNSEKIRLVNTYINNLTTQEALKKIDEFINDEKTHYIVTPNSDVIVKIENDNELKKIYSEADLVLTDGMILIKLSKLFYSPIVERIRGASFILDICNYASVKKYSIFLLGGEKDILCCAETKLQNRFPQLMIKGAESPIWGFEKDEKKCKEIVHKINKSKPDIVFVFLGTPKQDKFIYKYKEHIDTSVLIAFGGAIDNIAGKRKNAPIWMQNCGLEWLFRLIQEPKRLFKRYLIDDVRVFKLAYKYRNKLE